MVTRMKEEREEGAVMIARAMRVCLSVCLFACLFVCVCVCVGVFVCLPEKPQADRAAQLAAQPNNYNSECH